IDLFARVGASPESTAPPMKRIEKRSLALHKAAVQELRTNPTALKRARATIKRWMSRYKGKPPQALREWSEILAQPVDRIAELALDRSEYGDRIRKSSPLSVLVPKEDRRRIYAAN
ncbi:MAG TPA: hypothetical protein VN878_08405, partial [Usitatibacter sp.]|nr:hypothetical protein [Usitatibacter sp.]